MIDATIFDMLEILIGYSSKPAKIVIKWSFQMIKSIFLVSISLVLFACGNDFDPTNTDRGPYRLTFSLDSSFKIPHATQPIRIALVRLTDGTVIA